MKSLLLGLVVGVMLAAPALAHRGHATLSVVEIDAATGRVTVNHRMDAHDVEPALAEIAPGVQANLDDPDALAALIAYTARAFVLLEGTEAVELAHHSTDLRGDQVRLTYVGRMPTSATRVIVDSNLFVDTHDDQENQVNVRRAKVTKTVVFRQGTSAQEVSFP